MFESRPDRDHEILLVGRSNVGKSTLMAELTGHAVETGQRPGVTQSPNHFDWTHPSVVLTDLPGFGFMAGVPDADREQIKTDVIQYIERVADDALVAILVVDGKAVIDIIDRHTGPDEVAHVVELFGFLQEVGIPTVVAVNKMDKVPDRDDRLDALCDRLGLPGPWQQWQDTIAPVTAKRGAIGPLESAVRDHLHDAGRDDVIGLLF